MSQYQSVLEAAEQHLRSLQATGVRFVNIRAATLGDLQHPVPMKAASLGFEPAEARPKQSGEITLPGGTRLKEETQEIPPIQPLSSGDVSVPLVTGGVSPSELEQSLPPKPPEIAGAKAAAMAALREKVLACVKCPNLVATRRSVVFGVGDINARLLFVGEAPGMDEDEQGEPFVGAAGQLLTRIIKAMGFTRETVYIANILKCRPDTPGQTSGNRKPTPSEMQTCIPWLHEQIDLIQPAIIVALGGVAVEGMLGKGEGISRLRGQFQTYRGIPVMPTFHPSYLLRNQATSEKRKVWEDMLQVLEKLGDPISEKQRGYFLKA